MQVLLDPFIFKNLSLVNLVHNNSVAILPPNTIFDYFSIFRFTFKLQRPPPNSQIGDATVNAEDNIDINTTNSITSTSNSTKVPMTEKQQQLEDFDYNSFVLQDDDSETEEFVNIVVNEFATEMTNDEAEKLINEVKEMKRSSIVPPQDTAGGVENGLDSVDRSTPIPITVENVDEEIAPTDNTPLTNQKRSFSFFKRNKNNNNSSLSSPLLPRASSIRRRSTSDASFLGVKKDTKTQVFESSLNFEPNTTPVHAVRKKEVRITEPPVNGAVVEREIDEEVLDSTTSVTDSLSNKRASFFHRSQH